MVHGIVFAKIKKPTRKWVGFKKVLESKGITFFLSG